MFSPPLLGGCPVFSPSCIAFSQKLICGSCSTNSAFILQISCPVDNTSTDRVLYFFACVNPACSKKEYFIYRVLTNSAATKQTTCNNSDNLFEDDWGTPSSNDVDTDLSKTLQQGLNLNGPAACYSEDYVFFKSSFISVFEEPNKEFKISKKELENFENLAKSHFDEKNAGEGYEKEYSNAFKDDKINYHFYKRLRRCPEQIIRYDWLGQPLHSCANADAKPDPCKSCGTPRVFELQLMPALINILSRTKRDNVHAGDLDFETILVYTCGNNCSISGQTVYKEQLFVFKDNVKL